MWTDRQMAMLEAMGLRIWSPSRSRASLATESAPMGAPADASALAVPGGGSAANLPRLATPSLAPRPVPASVVDARSGISPRPPADGLPAEPASVATMDWAALRRTVASCTACRLCESRRQTVFGAGHPRAHWMIVGEAPGEQEDQRGEPFLGKSGQLLDNMLRAIGLERPPPVEAVPDTRVDDFRPSGSDSNSSTDPARQVYLCNTVKCRPPGSRTPQADEFARCHGYLLRQLELVQPRIILTLGQFAAQSLLGSELPFGRLRGQVHRYHGVPLIATYHPAYLLRNPEDKAKAWDDLCLAVEALQQPGSTPSASPTAPVAAASQAAP